MAFIHAARFCKHARNNETAAFWYHPLGSKGYTVAAASLNKASTTPELSSSPPPSSAPSANPLPKPPPPDDFLQHVLLKYHDFASVFSPVEVENLPPHRPGFDAAIELEEGKSPPFGPLYHLLQQEREVLFGYPQEGLYPPPVLIRCLARPLCLKEIW